MLPNFRCHDIFSPSCKCNDSTSLTPIIFFNLIFTCHNNKLFNLVFLPIIYFLNTAMIRFSRQSQSNRIWPVAHLKNQRVLISINLTFPNTTHYLTSHAISLYFLSDGWINYGESSLNMFTEHTTHGDTSDIFHMCEAKGRHSYVVLPWS